MKEEWKIYKTVKWYNKGKLMTNVYEVSSEGNVKKNGQIVDFSKQKRYYQVGHFYVHRMVAEMFIPNPENKPCIDHIDTNIHNNNVNNLRWTTYSENLLNPITQKRKSKSFTEYCNKNGSPFKNHSHTREAKDKMSEKAKERTGEKNSFYNKSHSEKTRKQISESLKLYYKNKRENKQ